ncbi:MAG: glutathione S-transferase N-terminal domain-containing protein [Myxococcales bacterium]|nr:glutathione S-transferase N-terminal domain-containing protein [Myxococcales bacterium]
MTIRIYTTRWCGYCRAAKALLNERGLAFEEIPVDGDSATRARLAHEHDGYSTVPMVFIDDRFIGGYDQLAALDRAGKLAGSSHS